jgi:hypothetical protein
MTRSLLRQQLADAWRQTISDPYRNQLINSERGLQVYFCVALLEQFKNLQRRLFIEPAIRLPGRKVLYPDIVICNSRSIIGVVELKYLPRAQPKFSKDLKALASIADAAHSIEIANDRFRGVARRQYPLAKDAVLSWAGVYTGDKVNLANKFPERFRDRFLQLDEVTR